MTVSLGFVSVRRHAEHGYFGGYLITNQTARPLEFHCTMPVKPSRAQELLYGPTMDAFVCGEQIAKALTTKAKIKPDVLLTDCEAVLAISSVSELDAALLQCAQSQPEGFRPPSGPAGDLKELSVGKWHLFMLAAQTSSEARLVAALNNLTSNFDLTEPFQRISEALLEAHPIARAA